MICLIFQSASQLALIGQLQARTKLNALNMKTKKVEKVITALKDRIGHALKKSRHESTTLTGKIST